MCFCCGAKTKSLVEASFPLSALFASCGVFILLGYILLSILWKRECESYNNDNSDLVHMECGSYSMWACVGWGPTLVFIFMAMRTSDYICKQSQSNIKVLNSSRAWLLSFFTVLFVICYFIHWCYIIYIIVDLQDNGACEGRRENKNKANHVDCDNLDILAWLVWVSATLVMVYMCCGLSCLFGIVNGAIATPIDRLNEERVRQRQRKVAVIDEGDDVETATRGPLNLLGKPELTEYMEGDRVVVCVSHQTDEAAYGTLRFYGIVKEYPTTSGVSFPYLYGVELDDPKGNNNGTLEGSVYFENCFPQFGVFVGPSEMERANPALDPQNMFETVGGVTIGRQKPNHFLKPDLTEVIAHMVSRAESERVRIKEGRIRHVRMATVKQTNAYKVSRELLDLLPHIMLSAVGFSEREKQEGMRDVFKEQLLRGRRHNTGANLNGVMFNAMHACGRLLSDIDSEEFEQSSAAAADERRSHRSGHSARAEEKINLAYVQLSSEWHRYCQRLVDDKYVDWSGGMADGMTQKWIEHNQAKARQWLLTLLHKDESVALNVSLPPVRQMTCPRFIEETAADVDMATRKSKYWPHCLYIPLGIFTSGDAIMDLPQIPRLTKALFAGETVSFEIKNLVHEPIERLEELAPFWRYELYEESEEYGEDYGWFPVDVVYLELQFEGSLGRQIAEWYDAYEHYLDDKQQRGVHSLSGRFNPFYLLRYPRIPLCYLGTLLPIEHLSKYLRKMDRKRRKKAYGLRTVDDTEDAEDFEFDAGHAYDTVDVAAAADAVYDDEAEAGDSYEERERRRHRRKKEKKKRKKERRRKGDSDRSSGRRHGRRRDQGSDEEIELMSDHSREHHVVEESHDL